MKIVFLEGMPGVGKTTIINYLKKQNINGINIVDEIVLKYKHDKNNQDFFMQNDIKKITKYNDGIIIIDRGLISTLSYNEFYYNDDYINVLKWFNEYGKKLYKSKNVFTYYLKNNKYIVKEKNKKDPYGSIGNQKKLEKITIKNIKKYCLNYKIIDYNFNDLEEFVSEIIN